MTRPQMTVMAALDARLASDPDGPYLDLAGEAFTAREIDLVSNRVAHALHELGIGHGDRVATLLENRAEQVISFFAALKLGAVQVPINTAYKGEYLRHQLGVIGIADVTVVQAEKLGYGPDAREAALKSAKARIGEIAGAPARQAA